MSTRDAIVSLIGILASAAVLLAVVAGVYYNSQNWAHLREKAVTECVSEGYGGMTETSGNFICIGGRGSR